jgi:putative transposase
MIPAKERGKVYVNEQAPRGADDRRAVTGGGGAEGGGRSAGSGGVETHDSTPGKRSTAGWTSEAEEVKQLRDEDTRLRKPVADLSLDKEALQSVIRKKGQVKNTRDRNGYLSLLDP